MGLAASSLLLFKNAGLLEAYQPKGVEALKPAFRSSDGSWTGQDAFLGVICFNTVEGQKSALELPKSWKDLTDAKYKDKLVMPHPASSGTGYLTVAAWMQLMGEAEAWKFMDALHQNIAVYTHSGSAPCVQSLVKNIIMPMVDNSRRIGNSKPPNLCSRRNSRLSSSDTSDPVSASAFMKRAKPSLVKAP